MEELQFQLGANQDEMNVNKEDEIFMRYIEEGDDTINNAKELTEREMWANFDVWRFRDNVVELVGSSILIFYQLCKESFVTHL